jgi:hypothetical protein
MEDLKNFENQFYISTIVAAIATHAVTLRNGYSQGYRQAAGEQPNLRSLALGASAWPVVTSIATVPAYRLVEFYGLREEPKTLSDSIAESAKRGAMIGILETAIGFTAGNIAYKMLKKE